MRNYIKSKRSLDKGSFLTHSAVNIVVKDDLLFELEVSDLEDVIDMFPKAVTKNIDYIIFGNFDFLRKKNYNASYKDGAIYVLNDQEGNADILDDIVHEIGHSVEDNHQDLVYGDGALEMEFLKKREILRKEFSKEGIEVPEDVMSNPEYDQNLDMFFSEKVGYPRMTTIVQGIFYSPYGATSLREYFANGFEAHYYHRDVYLQRVSPVLYSKISKLEELHNET
jgi:hypothetical protein